MIPLTALVVPEVTAYTAQRTLPLDACPHLRGIELADPDPSSQHPIHLLIGLSLFTSILVREPPRLGPKALPLAQKTIFGWIVSGPAGVTQPNLDEAHVSLCIAQSDTDVLLRKFWEDEEVPQRLPPTPEDEQCERHFLSTYSRTTEGRYMVRLPFKTGPQIDIGDSLPIATALYARTEGKFQSRPEVSRPYHDFLREYLELGHMESVDEKAISVYAPVYIPHHAVMKESSSTTKLRVVFNASSRTRNGTTLNDHLLVGPKLQQDLPAIIARWRQWRYVYTADIAKMFRQILVDPTDADFQRILWRPTPESQLRHYRLRTVTYGLASAPYLAMRVLQQLAVDDGHRFPVAVPIIENSIYIDDALFGQDSLHNLREARDQLIGLMRGGGFQLRKWAANSPNLLEDIPMSQRELTDHFLAKGETLKILGLSWRPQED